MKFRIKQAGLCRRWICGALVLLLLLTLVCQAPGHVRAAGTEKPDTQTSEEDSGENTPSTSEEIRDALDALEERASDLDEQEDDLRDQLDDLAGQEAAKLEAKALLEQEISVLSAQIFTTQEIIEEYDVRIADKQKELEEAQAEEDEYYDLFCRRVRFMEESGRVTYWSILFGASSFADLLDRIQTISLISQYDNQVVEQLRDAKEAVADAKADLEEEQAEQTAAEEELERQEADLETAELAVEAAIEEINSQTEVYESQLAEIEAESETLQDEIAQAQLDYEAAVAREEAAAAAAAAAARSSSSSYSPGSGRISMIWPTTSYTISSSYGSRSSPTAGASTYHRGIDIAASSGSPIYAAADGTVTTASYSSSEGNYIIIYHGSGVSTIYMHCSALYVSVGQTVSQGQTIAAVGSTGISTGPHLHFGVIEDGVYVNPLNYVG